ncbi:hypothetical protein FGG78_22055 [Thioclava sp. BHET1]|nr:hypothetical protein FGG78_22055 [Thioclava sp. BHET1]
MEREMQARRSGAIIVFAGAAAGMAIAIYASLASLSPVAGRVEAWLLVMFTFLLALAARGLPKLPGRLGRNILRVIMLLAILGIAFAAAYLEQVWIDIAMLLAFLGWLIDLHSSKTPSR